MQKRGQSGKPTFIWQAILISLPVVLLAGAGFLSLRQDQSLAAQEAKERARAWANDLARKIWEQLVGANDPQLISTDLAHLPLENSTCRFQADEQGNLVFPPPYAVMPIPKSFEQSALTDQQAQLWQAARLAEYRTQNYAIAATAWREFLQAAPPQNYRAEAQYALAVVLQKEGQLNAASEAFDRLSAEFPEAVGESGLPLKPLAAVRRLQLAMRDARASTTQVPPGPETPAAEAHRLGDKAAGSQRINIEALCADAIQHPSALTPLILSLASQWQAQTSGTGTTNFVWTSLWANHERARKLYQVTREVWRRDPARHHWEWIQLEEPWLAVPIQEPAASVTNIWVICRPERRLAQEVSEMVREAQPQSDYYATSVEVAGKQVLAAGNPARNLASAPGKIGGSGQADTEALNSTFPILATATKMMGESTLLKVRIFLTNPARLYARQRVRTFWFGALIAVAVLAALVGLLAAWRAFHRQLLLNELKTNFVSSVSHELRSPIASVRLMAESLERGRIQSKEKTAEYFRFIVQECRRLSSLIENVLDFSRIEQGRKQYEMEPTDLRALVTQTVQVMAPYATERQIELVTQLPSPMPEHSDATASLCQPCLDGRAIQQALVNLIDNALKHSPAGSTVTIGLDLPGPAEHSTPADGIHHESPPARLKLWVADHGTGIPPEEHERIFERFYRCGSELRRETQGVGIGLSIVKHVVEAHGGRVTVQSAVGQGSRFTIELPVKVEDL